jgi:hypothetical protein
MYSSTASTTKRLALISANAKSSMTILSTMVDLRVWQRQQRSTAARLF